MGGAFEIIDVAGDGGTAAELATEHMRTLGLPAAAARPTDL
jgi:hypothetical protein